MDSKGKKNIVMVTMGGRGVLQMLGRGGVDMGSW